MDDPGILVPIIGVMIPIVALVMINWRKVQMRRLDLLEQSGSDEQRRADRRIERLEARVAVLERIVTDKGLSISDEIERLRDQPYSEGRA